MELFLSTIVNKVDKKGRISVPSAFRATLSAQGFAGVVLFPSPVGHPAIEGWSLERMQSLSAGIGEFAPFGEETNGFSSILADSLQLGFDPEGRITIPSNWLTSAAITDSAAFVGRGATFQIWEPSAFQVSQARARIWAKNNREKLKLSPRKGAEE